VTLGEHPVGGTNGPALTIEWEPVDQYSLPIDALEGPRRRQSQLKLPAETRRAMLSQSHSAQEMDELMKESKMIQKQRAVSFALQDIEQMEMAWQSAVKRVKRWTRVDKNTGSEAEDWLKEYKKVKKCSLRRYKSAEASLSTSCAPMPKMPLPPRKPDMRRSKSEGSASLKATQQKLLAASEDLKAFESASERFEDLSVASDNK
jgi:hypothetical protein